MRLLLPLLLATPALATPTFIDFEDGTSAGIPTNFYASRGLSFLRFSAPQVGVNGNGLMVAMQGAPPPSQGQALWDLANLAGFLGDFELVFAQPQRYFTLDAFNAGGEFTITAFNGTATVFTQAYPQDAARTYTQLHIETAGPIAFTRVLIDVQNTIPVGGPFYGPNMFDNLAFDTVPAPAPSLIMLAANTALARRRR